MIKKKGSPMENLTFAKLKRLVDKGMSDTAIGKQYGVTRQAVHQRRNRFGIASRFAANAERNEKIGLMYLNNKSVSKIAKKFKLSSSQTYRIIKSQVK